MRCYRVCPLFGYLVLTLNEGSVTVPFPEPGVRYLSILDLEVLAEKKMNAAHFIDVRERNYDVMSTDSWGDYIHTEGEAFIVLKGSRATSGARSRRSTRLRGESWWRRWIWPSRIHMGPYPQIDGPQRVSQLPHHSPARLASPDHAQAPQRQ